MTLLVRFLRWLTRTPPPPVFDERDAYQRLHGERVTDLVVTPKPPPKPRVLPKLAGDYLRRCFEERLERRHAAADDAAEALRLEAVVAAARLRDERGEQQLAQKTR
jgi:hypothetical protein